MKMEIPFTNIKLQHDNIKNDIEKRMGRVMNSCQFVLGEELENFEKEFSSYCQTRYGIGVASGTDALTLSIKALNIGPGDEVITVPNTFIATADAIYRNGAKPVFVDIDSDTYNIDIDKIEEKITEKTKAIIPVHLYGNPVEMGKLSKIANDYGLRIIEDACQAHGAKYKNQRVGSFGDVGCFSFYPSKNLGAYGDGGIVVTNNLEIAEKLKMLRNYGQRKKYYHDFVGYNSRLDDIQAAILKVKLEHLDKQNNLRYSNAKKYNDLLYDIDYVITQEEQSYSTHVYHLYVIRCEHKDKNKNRDCLQRYLASKGISTGIHYPIPIHLQKAYGYLGYKKDDFPISESYAENILSLPMFSELTDEEIIYIITCINKFYE